ncbi:NAD(P)-binding domain-containing protein [Draconibacterium sp. IB214405]|uniref:pyrroline-5-carboxylate reductase family protein n=1 Tax=Draconibacterium sp. IB214405 TaxID=3097352 RepID=UPI002A0F5B23|nr:NAD(P)-binding domain-containing protein [Draconibacterium sp. IB214405]MDX8340455.1 NAD(P)-binding domain-containing protein [Draconibacterium sp. IB214405]
MKTKTIGFIGGGRITKIFLQAFQNKKVGFENVKVFDPNSETLSALNDLFPGIELAESAHEAAQQQLVVLAVHPPVMAETLAAIKDVVTEETQVLSLAPKVTIEKITGALGTSKVVRMIPNATSFINKGYNPVAFHSETEKKAKKSFMKLVKALGKNFEVEENKLEGYAIVSAMLPTYFWFQWEEMLKVAEATGLEEKEAQKAVEATLKKSLSIFFKSGMSADEVKDLVPVKPIGEAEEQIKEIYQTKLLGLYEKIKA